MQPSIFPVGEMNAYSTFNSIPADATNQSTMDSAQLGDNWQVVILSNESSIYFARLLQDKLAQKKIVSFFAPVVRQHQSGGGSYIKFGVEDQDIFLGKDCIYVSSLLNDTDFFDLFRVASTLSAIGTRSRIFVIPFLGYSTMERAVNPGEIVSCKTNIRLLSSLPSHGHGNTFLFFDLHTSGIIHYFEGNTVRAELDGKECLLNAIKHIGIDKNKPVFASADLGRPKHVEWFASQFGTEIALIRKTRSFQSTEVQDVVGDVEGRRVVIYDDMTRGGGTLLKAAKEYKKKNSLSVSAVLSHCALTNIEVANDIRKSSSPDNNKFTPDVSSTWS
ncbi:MAG: ribose-phosphate diphosphokinase [Streblomastix strix]|uniref:ribose-phosphate diphosphokinase n=1 Tax=Streblomastix strix TaxID=222440 RepID=A0A5J4W4L5_9EUKA|nr:MAG: ribose-phosphate diphosphokinase [Streblomastix strix]